MSSLFAVATRFCSLQQGSRSTRRQRNRFAESLTDFPRAAAKASLLREADGLIRARKAQRMRNVELQSAEADNLEQRLF